MLPHHDPFAAVLPSRQLAARFAARFDPRLATSHGGVMTASAKTDLHREAVRLVEVANPEINDRMRVELALPARLMWSWSQACNQPWVGPRDGDLMDQISRNFNVEMSSCLLGLKAGDHLGRGDDRVKIYNRILKAAEIVLMPIQACPVNVRPSNLTGFMACSFLWQKLIADGALELEEKSLFHRTWDALADVVVLWNTMDDLVKARKSALKRMEVMMAALKEQGYYA